MLRRTQPLVSGTVARSNQTAVWHPHVSSEARLYLVPGSCPSEFAHRIAQWGPPPGKRRKCHWKSVKDGVAPRLSTSAASCYHEGSEKAPAEPSPYIAQPHPPRYRPWGEA